MHGESNGHSLPSGRRLLRCRPSHVLALSVSVLAHFGLVSAFSAGGSTSFGYADGISFEAPMRTVQIKLDAPPDEKIGAGEEKGQEVKHRIVTASQASSATHQEEGKAGIPSAPHYFAASELTRKPLVTHDLPADLVLRVPGVPAQAAILRMLINEYGDIDRIIVENSLLPDSAQKVVVDAFSKIRFYPGEINGKPVKSQLKIEVILNDAVSAI